MSTYIPKSVSRKYRIKKSHRQSEKNKENSCKKNECQSMVRKKVESCLTNIFTKKAKDG